MTYIDRMRGTIKSHAMLTPGDTVLVAVSGGPDSLSLLHALRANQDEIGLAGLVAAHFDHRLRGDESAADAVFVAAFCRDRDIPCHLGSDDVGALARARKVSVQQAARSARYAFLERAAGEIGASKIATGHTQDDQAETILLHILRGTGLAGLRGIPYRRGLAIRPLLDITRAEVEKYCREQVLTPRCDPSNLDAGHYTRNRIRLELLPQLARDYNPGVRSALLRLSEIAGRDADYLQQHAEALLPEVILTQTELQITLDNKQLRTLHPALLRYVLRQTFARLRGTGGDVTYDHVESLCAAINGQVRLPFGITLPAPHCAVRVTQRRTTVRRVTSPTTRPATA